MWRIALDSGCLNPPLEHRLYIKRTSMAETSHRHRHVMRSDGQRLTRYPRRSAQEWPVPFGSLR